MEKIRTLENSTPAKLKFPGVQKERHASTVMLLTSVNDATRRVRDEVESLQGMVATCIIIMLKRKDLPKTAHRHPVGRKARCRLTSTQ